MIAGIIVTLIVVIPISITWALGIHNMKRNHPDYKGENFLDSDYKHPEWDENKSHTENF